MGTGRATIDCSAYIVSPAPRELFEDVQYFHKEIENINIINPFSQRLIRVVIVFSVMSIESFLNEEIENLLKDPGKNKKLIDWSEKRNNKNNFNKQDWEYWSPTEKWRLFLSLIKGNLVAKDKLNKSKIYKNFKELNKWRSNIVHRFKKVNIYKVINLESANSAIKILRQSLIFLSRVKDKRMPSWLQ